MLFYFCISRILNRCTGFIQTFKNKSNSKTPKVKQHFHSKSVNFLILRSDANLRWPTLISVAQRSAHCRHSAL